LKALKPAFPKGTTKAKVVGMLQKMNHVVLHQDGDYILMQGISNPPFDMGKPYKGTSIQERLLLWASMHIDPYYEGRYTGMDDSHSTVSFPTDIQKYKPMYGTKKKLFSIEKIKHSKDTNVRYFSATTVNSEGSSIIGSFEGIFNNNMNTNSQQMRNIEEFLSLEYKAKVDIGYFESEYENSVLIVRIEQILPNPPFDLPEKQQAINLGDAELAMKKFREWAENHIDPKLKAKMASSPAGTKFYEISVGGEGHNDLTDVYRLLGQNHNFGKWVKKRLEILYNADVEILNNNSELFTFKLYTRPKKKKSPKKNHPELMCIYKKSARSKPCGSPLREKKNPKGRYACRKCGSEYEMR